MLGAPATAGPRPNTLPKAPTAISGLDEVTGGGLPRGRTTLLCGPAGCGKTLAPLRKIIGDLSDTERVLVGLRLQSRLR